MKLQFGNAEQIKQVKADVINAEIGQAFDSLYLALCDKEKLSKKENQLFDHMEALFSEKHLGLTL